MFRAGLQTKTALAQQGARAFHRASGKDFFDYEFERKLDRGNFPHEHINFTKVLDEEVDTMSEEYLANYDAM